MSTVTRAQRAEEAHALARQGLNGMQIAKRMCISTAYTYSLLHDPDGTRERERKARYAGVCANCGGPTQGSDGRGPKASRRCQACEWANPSTKVWTEETVIAAIRRWEDLYGEPPGAHDWNIAISRRRGRTVAIERYLSGHWPPTTSVRTVFGSWNAAIAAAGFEPLRPAIGRRSNRKAAA